MSCTNTCRLCERLIISDAVSFTGDTLTIDIPARTYSNGEIYCIVVAQAIPTETTINAPVAFTVGGDTATLYPFVDRNGAPLAASQISTRTRYKTRLVTSAVSGLFKYTGCMLSSMNNLASIPVVTVTTTDNSAEDTKTNG